MSELDAVGTVLEGRYRVEALIGGAHAGGMVYRGRDATTGSTVVIRCPAIPTRLKGAAREEALSAFTMEAALLSKISEATPDVEKLIAFGIADHGDGEQLPYSVFEWLAGRSLERHLAERGQSVSSVNEAMVLLEPATRALSVALGMGISHRDIRPANLWLAESGGRTRLKVAAFALASRIGAGDSPFAPEYAAPEHFKKSYGALGPATDVYGLALCLVEMVTGRRPLEGTDPTELYLVTSDLGRRPTLRAHGAQVSDAVEQAVARALAVDPKRRWPTTKEFWDALVAAVPELTPNPPAVQAGMRPMSIPPGTTSPVIGTMRSSMPPPLESGGEARSRSAGDPRRRLPSAEPAGAKTWLVVGAVAVVAIVVIGAKVGTSRPKPAVPDALAPPVAPPRDAADAAIAPEEPAVRVQPFLTDMVRVPAGSFVMGSDKYEKLERPAHKVTLTHAYYIDRTEVTAESYSACVEAKACTPNRIHQGDAVEGAYGCNTDRANPRHPANCTDRIQAENYCVFAGKRLPTEAEWELAARGTDGRDYPWGNEPPTSCSKAILVGLTGPCEDGRKGTWEVGSTAEGKSPFGALDMAGNVWEWVSDGLSEYTTSDVDDPKIPLLTTGKGILRGGSYDYSINAARTSYRYAFPATSGHVGTGFRCARDASD